MEASKKGGFQKWQPIKNGQPRKKLSAVLDGPKGRSVQEVCAEYGMVIGPVPEIIRGKEGYGKDIYINKDFEHYLAMTLPVPKGIEVIS